MNKDFYKAINYIVLLIILVLIFHTSKTILKKYDIKINLELKETYLEYLYIFFFAIISGLLLFFGFKYFWCLKKKKMQHFGAFCVYFCIL